MDVRRLKENIWKGLDIVVPKKKVVDDDESMVRQPRLHLDFIPSLKVNFPGRGRR